MLTKNSNWCTEMDQKESIKITLSGIVRWIVGLFFIKIALEMLMVYEYLSAIFVFMAVFISFPPISNLIESELNILLSGAVKISLVIILLAGSLAVDLHSSSEISIIQTSSGSYNITQGDNVHYWNWRWNATSHTGYMKVTSEYK
jgi:hypothetical protein